MADRLAQLLGAVSLAATDRFGARVDDHLGRGGAHAAALIHLAAHPGPSIEGLRSVLGVSQPGTVKLVDRLVADGLVERRPGHDGRTRALHLTAAGARAADAVLADRRAELDAILAPLNASEREALLPLLEKVTAGLADDRTSAMAVCRLCDRDVCCGADGLECPLQHTVSA